MRSYVTIMLHKQDSKHTSEIQVFPPFFAFYKPLCEAGFSVLEWNIYSLGFFSTSFRLGKKKVLITFIHKHSLDLVSITSGLVHMHTFYYINKIPILLIYSFKGRTFPTLPAPVCCRCAAWGGKERSDKLLLLPVFPHDIHTSSLLTRQHWLLQYRQGRWG